MRHAYLHFLLLGFLLMSVAATAGPVTFRVDLHGQPVAAAGVHVAGSFQAAAGFPGNWNPATTALTDVDGDSIYEVTLNVPAGTYAYKYINGATWAGAELVPLDCGNDDGAGNINRALAVGSTVVRLPVTPFGACGTTVRFAVSMVGQTVTPVGVYVVGNFQALAGYDADWDPTATPLTDPDGDGTYEALISLPAAGVFLYKYVNGTTWAGAEIVPVSCGIIDFANNVNRSFDATAATTTLPTVCFGACGTCGGPPTTYATHWWNEAVFYEIFVRSFYDASGDGRGDFAGLIAKLDYLNDGDPATTTDLGVTGIWLMPMMQSPTYHGYDVTNYKATEPDYGTMVQFEAFLAAAHARGIKVIIDLVLNHSSSQHPWFTAAAASPTAPTRDWYRWSPTRPAYQGPWGQTVWHPRGNSYYYGIFWDGMPDLNWSNPALKTAMWDVSRFWLNKGVDGYRLDAIKYLDEDGTVLEDTPETFALLEELHDSVRAINPAAVTVGEAWTNTTAVVPYVQNDRLDICFEFDLALSLHNAVNTGNPAGLRAHLNLVNTAYPTLQYATFLTNHDQNRIFDQLGGSMAKMKQAAALYLTMPGVPFIYYGEEVAMSGTGPDEDKRLPMQWSAGPRAGFTTGNPWRAPNANYPQYNVATMAADPASLLNHYKKLIGLRNTSEVLRKGYYLPVTSQSAPILAFARVWQQEAVVVVANVSGAPAGAVGLALPMSSLAGGTYTVTDLYSGQAMGTVQLDAAGGFAAWTPTLTPLAANQTWVLRLTPQTSAVADAVPAPALSLFPNPATTTVRLELTGFGPAATRLLGIYDLSGRLLRSVVVPGEGVSLDVSDLPTDTYFLRVAGGAVQRLVVVR